MKKVSMKSARLWLLSLFLWPLLAWATMSVANHCHQQKEYNLELIWIHLTYIPMVLDILACYKLYTYFCKQ